MWILDSTGSASVFGLVTLFDPTQGNSNGDGESQELLRAHHRVFRLWECPVPHETLRPFPCRVKSGPSQLNRTETGCADGKSGFIEDNN